MELIEQVRELDGGTLDAILVPISGGGMAAGVALAARHASPTTRVFVVEPYGKNLTPALVANELTSTPGTLDTIADGMRSPNLGDLPFPIVAELAESRALPVTDEQIRAAMKLTMEQLKLVCEPSGAAGAARRGVQSPSTVRACGARTDERQSGKCSRMARARRGVACTWDEASAGGRWMGGGGRI